MIMPMSTVFFLVVAQLQTTAQLLALGGRTRSLAYWPTQDSDPHPSETRSEGSTTVVHTLACLRLLLLFLVLTY